MTLAQTVNDNLSGYNNGQPFTVGYVVENYQVRLRVTEVKHHINKLGSSLTVVDGFPTLKLIESH